MVIALKAAAALRDAAPLDTTGFPAFADRASTVLAASTHEGEDEAIVQGFAAARATRPDLRLILAPRHPRRGPRIAALLERAGLAHATRSAGEVPGPDSAVYLADTMGEMALWYRLAGITFVGGSLVDAGGHTPFEPAGAGSAILHGPHVGNFRTRLCGAGGGGRGAGGRQCG